MYTQEQKIFIMQLLEDLYEQQLSLLMEQRANVYPIETLNLMEIVMDSELIRDELEDLQENKANVAHTHADLHTHPNKAYLDNVVQNLLTTSRPSFTGLRSTDYAFTLGGKPNNNAILVLTNEGSSTQAEITVYNKSDWTNSSRLRILVNQSGVFIDSSKNGTGLLQDVIFSFNSVEMARITSSGIIKAKGFEVVT